VIIPVLTQHYAMLQRTCSTPGHPGQEAGSPARLPVDKTFDSFDFVAVPVVSKAQVMALASGDSWIENGANLLLFGPPEPAS
jgi:hypothetical protein